MSSPDETKASILVADADAPTAASARRVLERRGFRVTVANDGDQVLARFEPQVHVVILSVNLPRRDGLALLREIKQRSPQTQIILLTDPSSVSSAMMGLKEGAFAYLLKPIADYLQLTHAVEQALELHRLRLANTNPRPAAPEPRAQDFGALTQLSETVQYVTSQNDVLDRFLKSAAQLFDASKAVMLLANGAHSLQLAAGLGNSAKSVTARDFIRAVGEEFAWRVAHERKALTITSPNKKFAHVGAPLIVRERLVGVIIVYEIAAGRVDDEKLAWLQLYASQAAAAVELARLDDENARLTPIDPATGAYTDSAFLELAEREFRRTWRFNEFLSVIHVDIDGIQTLFKRNKAFGDHVMRIVSDVCRQSLRNIDLVARNKDNTFTLLLLMTDSAGAQIVAERISRAIQTMPQDFADNFRIALRLGVTTYPHEGCTSLMDLLEMARSAHSRLPNYNQTVIAHV